MNEKEKAENKLKATLIEKGRVRLRGWTIFPHQDVITHGIPDISWSGNKLTSWTEVKHATPDFKARGIQELNLLRLSAQGLWARYVVYYEANGDKRTYIVHPQDIGKPMGSWLDFKFGHDHDWVIEEIRKAHQ